MTLLSCMYLATHGQTSRGMDARKAARTLCPQYWQAASGQLLIQCLDQPCGVGAVCRYVMPRKALRALVANLLTVWSPKFKASGQVFKVGSLGPFSHVRGVSVTFGLNWSAECTFQYRTAPADSRTVGSVDTGSSLQSNHVCLPSYLPLTLQISPSCEARIHFEPIVKANMNLQLYIESGLLAHR